MTFEDLLNNAFRDKLARYLNISDDHELETRVHLGYRSMWNDPYGVYIIVNATLSHNTQVVASYYKQTFLASSKNDVDWICQDITLLFREQLKNRRIQQYNTGENQ